MQLTSLNRIIALLIVGSVPVIWGILRFYGVSSQLTAMGPIAAGPAIVVATVIFGILIDSVSELATQRFIKSARRSRFVASFFLQGKAHDASVQWGGLFQAAIEKSKFNPADVASSEAIVDRGGLSRVTAVGIFLKNAGKENFDWMATSDAVYSLCSNLATVTVLIGILEIIFGEPAKLYVPTVIFLFYLFASRSINRDLYTDMVIFRFSTLYCLEPKATTENQSEPSNSSAPS